MKVGDLVKNGQGHTGIVTALGGIHYREFMGPNTIDCPWENPDVHVITASGKKIWSYNALEVVSESR